MIRLLYNALFPVAFVFLLPHYLLRMVRRGNFRRDFGQRFGRYRPELRSELARGPRVWVHAVSVGELLVALRVIDELHRRRPEWRFVVSSTTSTAHAMAMEHRSDWFLPVYTPVDFAPVVRRVFALARPVAVILTESEMWPNFLWTADRLGIPVIMVNARVSPRSARRYRKFARFIRPVASRLTAVGLQEQEHATLWSELGVAPGKLHVTGSVKYDPDAATAAPRDFRHVLDAFGLARTDVILLGGSTHDGEEEILAASLRDLRRDSPALRLLIAPRHVERAGTVAARLRALGWNVALRTDTPTDSVPDILIINTTGELRDWYACADLVFIGKSLCGFGGQNPVEAILAERPVIFGPHMENFAALAASLVSAGGAVRVADAAELTSEAARLLAADTARRQLAGRGAECLGRHQGATGRTAEMILAAVKGSDAPAANV